jgi:hypothetical protein
MTPAKAASWPPTAQACSTTSAAANVAAAGTSVTLFADDAASLSGHHFLTNDQRAKLTSATIGLGAIGAAAGGAGLATAPTSAADAEEAAAAAAYAKEQPAGPVSEFTATGASKRAAIVPGEEPYPRRWAVDPDDASSPTAVTVDDIDYNSSDFEERVYEPKVVEEHYSLEPGMYRRPALVGEHGWVDERVHIEVWRLGETPDAGLDTERVFGNATPWDAVDAVNSPAGDTPWGPGPPRGATQQANPSALGATSNSLVKQASTTVTNTLQSNAPLVSPRPPQSPLGQNTSPASFSPF